MLGPKKGGRLQQEAPKSREERPRWGNPIAGECYRDSLTIVRRKSCTEPRRNSGSMFPQADPQPPELHVKSPWFDEHYDPVLTPD